MPRPAWSLYAYQLIEPDEQLDLFACQEVRVHLAARQLETTEIYTLSLHDALPISHLVWRIAASAAALVFGAAYGLSR